MRFFDKIKRYRLWDPITKQTSLENGKPRVRRRAALWSSTSFHNANRENLARGNATSDLFLASSLSSHVTNSIIQNYPNFPLFQRLKGEEEEGYPVKWCASSPPLSLSLRTLISKGAQHRFASFDTRQIYLYSSRALRAKASPGPSSMFMLRTWNVETAASK